MCAVIRKEPVVKLAENYIDDEGKEHEHPPERERSKNLKKGNYEWPNDERPINEHKEGGEVQRKNRSIEKDITK